MGQRVIRFVLQQLQSTAELAFDIVQLDQDRGVQQFSVCQPHATYCRLGLFRVGDGLHRIDGNQALMERNPVFLNAINAPVDFLPVVVPHDRSNDRGRQQPAHNVYQG